jgi:predicted enzyme related to lactoylglutathione lyase
MTVTHVKLVSVPVTDQGRARDFYLDMLDFDLIFDNPMGPGGRWIQVAPKGSDTALTLVTWFPSMPPGSLKGLVLETDDLDGDVARLRERGVDFPDGGIQAAPWGRYATLHDPDGNGIVLQSTRV